MTDYTSDEVKIAITMGENINGSYPTKEVECLKCGWVGTLCAAFPLRDSWCGHCRGGGHNLRLIRKP